MLLSRMKGSFTGTLSANGRLLTDQASGAVSEKQADGFPRRGYVRYPTAIHKLNDFTPSARLDCEDGRTFLIEIGDPVYDAVGQWVTCKFTSYGLTRRRHHTVWSRIFGSTTLGPFEWNLFRVGLSTLAPEIERAFAKTRNSPKTGIAEFDSLSSRSRLWALAVVAHSLHGQRVPREEQPATTQCAHAAVYAVILRLIRREIAARREGLSPEGRPCATRTVALAALEELCPDWDKPLPDVEAVGGCVTPYPTADSEKIEDWENLIGELKNHVSWWRPSSALPAEPDADLDEDDEFDEERNASDRARDKVSERRDRATLPIAPEPTDEQLKQSREILSQLCGSCADDRGHLSAIS
jgi:hypothetical protein